MTKLFAALAIFLFLPSAHAWLFFDPYIGYNRGQHQASRAQGIGYGARLGFEVGSLYIAGDMAMADLQQGALSSVKHTDTAAVIGGDFRNFRVWFGQIMSSTASYKSGASDIQLKGSGTKFGVGALASQKVFLNLEIKTIDYTESSTDGVATPIAEVATYGFLSVSWAF